jgi:hypothetical protein
MAVRRSSGLRKKTSKHNDFDYFWNRHQGTVALLAATLVKDCGGHAADYMGSIALTFNTFLIASRKKIKRYSDLSFKHSAFAFCIYYVKAHFVRYDSDLMASEWVNFKNGLGSRSLNLSSFKESKGKKVKVTTPSDSVIKNIRCREAELNWALGFIEEAGGIVPMWELVSSRLTARYKLIVKYRYILEMTFQDIGDIVGICRERVRQVIMKALIIIRNTLRSINNKEYLHLFRKDNVGFEY